MTPAADPREKVARAICEAEGIDPDDATASIPGWKLFLPEADAAIAAIAALREHDAEMIAKLTEALSIARNRASSDGTHWLQAEVDVIEKAAALLAARETSK